MQQSSESIASLAAALAKAQAELVNPEKSQVATIRSEGGRATAQNLRRLVKFLCRPPPSAAVTCAA